MMLMQELTLSLAQLGFGGGLLFGLPLVIIGLALRGLSRRNLTRLVEARRHERKITDVGEGPVMVTGIARRDDDGRLAVEDRGKARVFVEAGDVTVADGEEVLVFGTASAEASSGGYRQDARRWSIDARGDDALVLAGATTLGGRMARLRLQSISGGLVFSLGLVLITASAYASIATG
jgi:hypothetical protein